MAGKNVIFGSKKPKSDRLLGESDSKNSAAFPNKHRVVVCWNDECFMQNKLKNSSH